MSLCDCDKEKYKTTASDNDNEKIEKKIALKSKCQAMVDGMPLFGTRTDICEKGKVPETRSQREEKIRQVQSIYGEGYTMKIPFVFDEKFYLFLSMV